jgi:hypothetical protein
MVVPKTTHKNWSEFGSLYTKNYEVEPWLKVVPFMSLTAGNSAKNNNTVKNSRFARNEKRPTNWQSI